jgi:photosystem II stability/assembly factor-like uncharacterized protein
LGKGILKHRGLLCSPLLLLALTGTFRLVASPESSQPIDRKFFGALAWRSVGPFRGGRVLAVTGVRGQPDIFYSGSVGGGVWKTNDAGRTWNPIFDSQPIASIGALAVAPSEPNIIYVGSGEADMRSSISYGDGMYKSLDAGRTWAHIGLEDSRQIGRILVDPHDPNRIFVAALGHAYGPNEERGVYRSEDGGRTWKRILFHDENTGAIDLAFEPGDGRTIYAALWQTRRPPWNIYAPSNGPGSGLYRSRDGGDHWEPVTGKGLPSEGLGRIGIAFAPSNPRRIYLIVDAKDGGLYRSDDGGQNWWRASNEKRTWGRGWYFGELTVDPKDPETVYVPNTSLYKSTDGGKTFTAYKGAPDGDDYHAFWIDPDEPKRMIVSSDQGAIITLNGGETWSSWYNQPNGQFYHVATDNRFPYWIYGAQQDSGSAAVSSRGKFRGLGSTDWRPVEAGDENGYIAPDPLDPGVIFGGFVDRQEFASEQVQRIPPTLAHSGDFRRTWTLPLVFSPRDPQILYFSSQVLFRTADAGNSWQAISPDLTREDPGVPSNLDPSTAADAPKGKRRGVIYTIAPSPVESGEIWVGTDDGLIHRTDDEGKTWENVTPPALMPWSKVTHIEASHFLAATAYAAVDRHRLDDQRPYLYRTQSSGKNWELVSNGIPEGSFLNCVREDPVRVGLLYACTEKGVYVSFDAGDHWQSLELNLPVTSVRDLVVHGDDLVVATFGRGFWVLDDITPLRQFNPQMATSETWLFRPQIAYRVRQGKDQGTEVPFDEPQAANPPEGAVIDYYLREKPATPLRLEIFDADGKLVRRFSSDDKPRKTSPSDVPFPTYWLHEPQPLSADAGMHRFVWDLRYALPQGVRDSPWRPRTVFALPGSYTVKFTANGKSFAESLTVVLDPRVKAPEGALVRQFKLASRLSAKLGEASAAEQQFGALGKETEERKRELAGHSELEKLLDDLQKRWASAAAVERGEDFMELGLSLPEKHPEPLAQVVSALGTLISYVESADADPTADMNTASEAWLGAADEAIRRWQVFVENDLAAVNAQLRKANQKPLAITENTRSGP